MCSAQAGKEDIMKTIGFPAPVLTEKLATLRQTVHKTLALMVSPHLAWITKKQKIADIIARYLGKRDSCTACIRSHATQSKQLRTKSFPAPVWWLRLDLRRRSLHPGRAGLPAGPQHDHAPPKTPAKAARAFALLARTAVTVVAVAYLTAPVSAHTPAADYRASGAFSVSPAGLPWVADAAIGTAGTPAVTERVSSPYTVPPPLTLPTGMKGVNYFPRGHAWWSMLYDWYTLDCTSSTLPQADCAPGEYVYQVVQNDLQMLHTNGIDFIHLYIWDQDLVQDTLHPGTALLTKALVAPGFVGWDDGGPQSSPGNPLASGTQWSALAAFVSLAQANGIWLSVEFAARRPTLQVALPGYSYSGVGSSYGGWVNEFVNNLQSYHNVLVWGLQWSGLQGPYLEPDWNAFWQAAYPLILSNVQNYPYTSPAGRALLMMQSGFGSAWTGHYTQPILSGYKWTWQASQQEAYYCRQIGITPDVYAFMLYNANAADLEAALECVAGVANSVCPAPTKTPCGSAYCPPIQFSQMVVTEVATGSSFASSPLGKGSAAAGDVQTPTSSASGQSQWLTDTLCVVNRHSIPAFAWFGLYDSASWWEANFDYRGAQLAWTGYWGLSSEVPSSGNKPAWTAMLNYPASCPSSSLPPAPVLALYADATYYTVGDPATITYGAANVTSLSLSEPVTGGATGGILSCGSTFQVSAGTSLVGSCASAANVTMPRQTGQLTITLTGANTDVAGALDNPPTNGSASITVTVGPGPILTGIVEGNNGQSCNFTQNPGCTITASQGDMIEIYGEGFNPLGGNAVNLIPPGGSSPGPLWLYITDGYYYWEGARTQINAQIACYVTPGVWQFDVWNPHQEAPSSTYSINIVSSSSCN